MRAEENNMKNLDKLSVSEQYEVIDKCISRIDAAKWAEDYTKFDDHDIFMFIGAQRELVEKCECGADLFKLFYTTSWNAIVLKGGVTEKSREASLVKQYIRVCKAVLNGNKQDHPLIDVNECWRWLKRIETSAISKNLEALMGIQSFELMGGESDE